MSEVIDMLFPIAGHALRPDYALPLWQCLRETLPWLSDEPDVGVLPLTRASAGNGVLYLGGRAQLTLRLPQRRVADAHALSGRKLALGEGVTVGEARLRPLLPSPAQYSPCVTFGCDDETAFLALCATRLAEMGVDCRLICGKAQTRAGESGEIRGFSLMLHGLTAEHALRVQQLGLGEARKLGCGIFVPHKTTTAVGAA